MCPGSRELMETSLAYFIAHKTYQHKYQMGLQDDLSLCKCTEKESGRKNTKMLRMDLIVKRGCGKFCYIPLDLFFSDFFKSH